MIYIVSVWFMQTVTDHMVERKAVTDQWNSGEAALRYYLSSLARTILSLWQAISGGADWDSMAHPLITEVHSLMGVAFAAYIAFALLALLNVVTGVFVQTALQSALEEEDNFME